MEGEILNRPRITIILSLLFLLSSLSAQFNNGDFENSDGGFTTEDWTNNGGTACGDVPPGGGNWSLSFDQGCVWGICSHPITEIATGKVYAINLWAKLLPGFSSGEVKWSHRFRPIIQVTDTVWTFYSILDTLHEEDLPETLDIMLMGGGGFIGSGGACFDLVKLECLGIAEDPPTEPDYPEPQEMLILTAHDSFAGGDQFKLLPLFPNPFNDQTTIRYSLEKHGQVKLLIYNQRGLQIFGRELGSLSPGNYRYNWDASRQAAGIYIVEVRSGHQSARQKVLLLR